MAYIIKRGEDQGNMKTEEFCDLSPRICGKESAAVNSFFNVKDMVSSGQFGVKNNAKEFGRGTVLE